MTLFGNRVAADVISKNEAMLEEGPFSSDRCLRRTFGHRDMHTARTSSVDGHDAFISLTARLAITALRRNQPAVALARSPTSSSWLAVNWAFLLFKPTNLCLLVAAS